MKTNRTLIVPGIAALLLFTSCIKTYIIIPSPPHGADTTANNGGTGTGSAGATDTTGANDTAYVVSTLAGGATAAFIDGTGTAAAFSLPMAAVTDAAGNCYVVDYSNNAVRKITPAGVVTTLAGSGSAGSTDGVGKTASFNAPQSLGIDPSGNIYVSDYGNNEIRKVTTGGATSTFAGALIHGYVDATGSAARFESPKGIAGDGLGNLYVWDSYHIRKITPGATVTTFVGTGSMGKADGTGTSASIGSAPAMTTDAANNIYFVDEIYQTVRKITPAGVVTTIAGRGDDGSFVEADGQGAQASFWGPMGICVDRHGNIFVSDMGGATIRKITPDGKVITIAGIAGVETTTDGPGHQATFNHPAGIAVAPNGIIYVCEAFNDAIRILTPKR